MLRKFVVLSGLVVLGAFAAGCKDDCEAAADDITAAYEECGFTVPSGDGSSDGDGECTDEAAALATCTASCVTAAPCGALDGSDAEAALDYIDCLANCL